MKFLCDEMLGGLARWLRAAGYDADMAVPGEADRGMVRRARAQSRRLITRDRALLQIKHARDIAILLHAQNLDGWAEELGKRHGLNWLLAPLSRCLVCNVNLVEADTEALSRMPEDSRALGGPFRMCPSCKRGYWPGSHVKRMKARLQGFAALAGQNPVEPP